tara:strand:+ start:6980 stop:7228 length:249 start_codon:yes stop_codon:yes gene_type:complete
MVKNTQSKKVATKVRKMKQRKTRKMKTKQRKTKVKKGGNKTIIANLKDIKSELDNVRKNNEEQLRNIKKRVINTLVELGKQE